MGVFLLVNLLPKSILPHNRKSIAFFSNMNFKTGIYNNANNQVNMNKLRIAVSQFPVSEDIRKNEMHIRKHIILAAQRKADIIHFPETALSGYETDINFLDWAFLEESLNRIKELAKRHNIHVILGAHQKHPQTGKCLNSVYLISKSGEIAGSYSKIKLYKTETERFVCGSGFLTEEINGIRCGFLICYDSCFPELFQHYRDQGVKILFLSYCNANSNKGRNSLDDLMEAQLRTRAADNMMSISGSNSSAEYSRMPSGVAGPDGKFTRLKRHKPGVLIYDYPDKTPGWMYDNSR